MKTIFFASLLIQCNLFYSLSLRGNPTIWNYTQRGTKRVDPITKGSYWEETFGDVQWTYDYKNKYTQKRKSAVDWSGWRWMNVHSQAEPPNIDSRTGELIKPETREQRMQRASRQKETRRQKHYEDMNKKAEELIRAVETKNNPLHLKKYDGMKGYFWYNNDVVYYDRGIYYSGIDKKSGEKVIYSAGHPIVDRHGRRFNRR